MSDKLKCEIRREKPKQHLGRYLGGGSWLKCGRVAIVQSLTRTLMCKECAEEHGVIKRSAA